MSRELDGRFLQREHPRLSSIILGPVALLIFYHIISHSLSPSFKACSQKDHNNFLVGFLVFCSYYAVPLMIIIVCYTKLALHVRQSNRLLASHMDPVSIEQSE